MMTGTSQVRAATTIGMTVAGGRMVGMVGRMIDIALREIEILTVMMGDWVAVVMMTTILLSSSRAEE